MPPHRRAVPHELQFFPAPRAAGQQSYPSPARRRVLPRLSVHHPRMSLYSKTPKVNLADSHKRDNIGTMETRIQTKYGIIRYNRPLNFTTREGTFLSNAIGGAFEILNACILKSEKGETDVGLAKAMNLDADGLSETLKKIAAEIKNGGIKCERGKIHVGADSREDPSVLACVSENGRIRIYDTFFDTKKIRDNRAGVIIHEAAHLLGLRGEQNTDGDNGNPQSAEAVKNFCLCACGKLSLEEIGREPQATPQPDASEEPTYRANPNRKANGEFDVGPDSGKSATAQSAEKNAPKPREEKSRNYIDSLPDGERESFARNGVLYEDADITTAKEDKKADAPSALDFKHNGFGNGDILLGADPDNPDGAECAWGAFSAKLDNLEKNAEYTVIQENSCKLQFAVGEKPPQKISVAHTVKTDENGCAVLRRVGVVHTPTRDENGDSLCTLEIGVDLKILKGSIKEHFANVEKFGQYNNSDEYVARHATLNGGGKIPEDEAGKANGRLVFSGKFSKEIVPPPEF